MQARAGQTESVMLCCIVGMWVPNGSRLSCGADSDRRHVD